MEYETSLEEPVDITIENTTNTDQAIRYYNVNFQDILKPGDSVKLTVTSSERLAYYTKIKESLEEITQTPGSLTPDDFARITFNYLNEEQGYSFISFEKDTSSEHSDYKFFLDETQYENVRINEREEYVVADNISFKVTLDKQGNVTDYEHLSN